MPREILSNKQFARMEGAPVGAKTDDYKERLLKYIPAEVVTLYMALKGIVDASSASAKITAAWTIITLGIVATIFYLYKTMDVPNWKQIIISTIAFIVWVLAIDGEPFVTCFKDTPGAIENFRLWTALILPVFTFGVASYEP